jgi:hypothetical protein
MQAVSLNLPVTDMATAVTQPVASPELNSLALSNPAKMDFAADLVSSARANNPNSLANVVANSFDEMQNSYDTVDKLGSSGNLVGSPEKLLSLQRAIDDLSISSTLASKIVGVAVKDIDTLVRIQ